MTSSSSSTPPCKRLVLDAGPLLSLSPLRGLAETYVTVPQVLAELKDKRAREHFEKLALVTGVKVEIQAPDAASLNHVIQFAKKTGDYSVLSQADLAVLALTYALDNQEKKTQEANEAVSVTETSTYTTEAQEATAEEPSDSTAAAKDAAQDPRTDITAIDQETAAQGEDVVDEEDAEDEEEREPLDVEIHQITDDTLHEPSSSSLEYPSPPLTPQSESAPPPEADDGPLYDDPSEPDDGEGEWITPSNAAVHKSRALGLTPSGSGRGKGKAQEPIVVGCMTADFAMQNVLLQMGLSLVGMEGKRIERVKTWVLRCHACFKICKDSSKKFCPSCGNPTLLRASVTISSPTAGTDTPAMQVHLKPNFQYKLRGTKYSIPKPKSGSAKTGSGEGLILREDQTEYMRAMKQAETKKAREEKKMLNGALTSGIQGMNLGNWSDPDWIPEIMASGTSGKGRRNPKGSRDDMPTIGYGRKNPNERKRHK